MAVAGGQVQGCVVSAVQDVNASSSHDEHIHHAGAALPARPVERAETVIVPAGRKLLSMNLQHSKAKQSKDLCLEGVNVYPQPQHISYAHKMFSLANNSSD